MKRTPEPKPPREKHGSLRALERAARRYCLEWYEWKHREPLHPTVEVLLDYRGELAAGRLAYSFENDARKILEKLKQATGAAADFVQRYPAGSAAFASEGVAAALPSMRRALQRADAANFHFAEEPSRRTWLRHRVARPLYRKGDPFTDHELSVYSILGGFWPDAVDAERVAENEHLGGVSVAEVMREERKRILKAKQKPKTQRDAETWAEEVLLPALKKRTST